MTLAMIGITIPSFVTAPLLQLVFGIYGVHIFGLDLSLPVGGWNGRRHAEPFILPVIVLALGPHRRYRAHHPREHGGSAALELHPYSPRQGTPDLARDRPSCAACGPLAARKLSRPRHRRHRQRFLNRRTIFGLPGIGRYFVQAALNRDYTLVLGVTVFYATMIITLNLLADLLYGVLDPRVRYE